MSEEFDKAFWEDHYRGHTEARSRPPNPHLVAEVQDLEPGTALDAGCGAGAEAIWLASHGWQVTAVDIVASALRHARERAEAQGADIASRIEWIEADLTDWTPAGGHFDLVTTHYVHPATSHQALFRRLAAAVAPGGTLLIVGHDPSDPEHGSMPEVCFTAEEVAAGLDPERWDIAVAEVRPRPAVGHDGHETTFLDAVLRARKRP